MTTNACADCEQMIQACWKGLNETFGASKQTNHEATRQFERPTSKAKKMKGKSVNVASQYPYVTHLGKMGDYYHFPESHAGLMK